MAASKINVNGNPQVYNATVFSLNGDDNGVDVNGYIQSVTWSTGEQAEHGVTIDPLGNTKFTNLIVSKPTVALNFAQAALQIMYNFINDKFTISTLILKHYTVGNIDGQKLNVLITGLRVNNVGTTSAASKVQNDSTVTFVATSAAYVTDLELSQFAQASGLKI